MRIFAILKIAARALRRNKLRTVLTMLGIIIGVGAVIATVSIGNGAKAMIEKQIASLGQNVLLIMSGNTGRGGFRMGFGSPGSLKIDDLEAIKREIDGLASISPEVRASGQVAAGNQNAVPSIRGVGLDFLAIRSWDLSSGQNFNEVDVRSANKVALIGRTAAETLFGANTDPVGQIIRIRNVPFRVVGWLKPKGMSMGGNDEDDVILLPYTSAMRRLTGDTSFRAITVQAANASMVPNVQNQIIELLRQKHRILPGREDDFIVRSQQEITETATESSKIMRALLAAVAGVSLVVGGIGIMNIMLVSVTERTREIGIRMAVGAKGKDILWQFLIEAVTLSVLGGSLGITCGVLGSHLISGKFGWPVLTSVDSIMYAFGSSAIIGVLFGLYPAYKASKLDPIDALRYE
ncbi:MAG TPA: ABC transporter permease [Candidatus Acidoferrum sp.]|nr:ABC transporter permease [Candidatus Acidoferrum sp.]